MEIAVVLYVFFYWMLAYLLRNRLQISPRRTGLLRAVLACSGFFLIGVILDLVEAIPQASVSVSIIDIDFYPIFLVSIGAVIACWALRDLARPAMSSGESARILRIDVSALPVTNREREVIDLILAGETNGSIADRLFISESTVKKHVNNIFRKLGISSRSGSRRNWRRACTRVSSRHWPICGKSTRSSIAGYALRVEIGTRSMP